DAMLPEDEVGVIAFDDNASWVYKLGPKGDGSAVKQAIQSIRENGGTMILPPMQEAFEALKGLDYTVRHVILLTDGDAADTGHEALAGQMAAAGITLSTVGLGPDHNQRFLDNLAHIAGGRYLNVPNPADLPGIFLRETLEAMGAYLKTGVFYPQTDSYSPILSGISGTLPALGGYVANSLKTGATQVIKTAEDDPVLAEWRYGLGRAVCWTSDIGGIMSTNWMGWEQGAAFFSAMVARILPDSTAGGLSLEAEVAQESMHVWVTSPDGTADSLTVIAPDGQESQVRLALESPGVYGAEVEAGQSGVYFLQAYSEGQLLVTGAAVAGYSQEYDVRRQADGGFLARLAQAGGGEVFTDSSQWFSVIMPVEYTHTDMRLALLVTAALLWVMGIAWRKLELGRLAKAWAGKAAGAASGMAAYLAARREKAKSDPTIKQTEKAGKQKDISKTGQEKEAEKDGQEAQPSLAERMKQRNREWK
nr:VWA domain-containing protein [bacterium]